MAHVFISYSKKNRDYARNLADHLLSLGFDVWIDDRIDYGNDWWRTIVRAIRNANAFIVIMSDESDSSEWVQREVTIADKSNVAPFPLWLSGNFHESDNWAIYVRTQYIDVRDGNLPSENFYNRLTKVIAPKSIPGNNVTPQDAEPSAPITDKFLIEEIAHPPSPDTATFPAAPLPKAIVGAETKQVSPFARVTSALLSLKRQIGSRLPLTVPSFRNRKSRLAVGTVIVLLLVGFMFLRGIRTVSPSNQILFTSNRNGNSEIYVTDGHNNKQLTNNISYDSNAKWSPDGRQIAFESLRAGNSQIFVMDAFGGSIRRLGESTDRDYRPDWSPDGSKISFDSFQNPDNNPNYEVFIMNVDGSGRLNLTNNKASDNSPVWSPYGSKIAFYSTRDGNAEIYVMNADGSQPTNLTNNKASDYDPSWSPDGKQIVFHSIRDKNSEVYMMNADGSQQHNITNDPSGDSASHWRPTIPDSDPLIDVPTVDVSVQAIERATATQVRAITLTRSMATKIAATAAVTTPLPIPLISGQIAYTSNQDGNYEIYTTDGMSIRQLTNNSAADENPDWSPDGRQIVFNSGRDGDHEIYLMDANGSNVKQLTNNPATDYEPIWSPDNERIAFTSYKTSKLADREIYVMNADGSNPLNLTNNPTNDLNPSWSLDGRQILFASDRDGDYDIYVMNADGSQQHLLTDNSNNDYYPTWSLDGRQILFASDRDGDYDIYVMNADGTEARKIIDIPDTDIQPSWSPDGKQILFTSYKAGNKDIYVMNADGTALRQITNDNALESGPNWRYIVPKPDLVLSVPTVNPTIQAVERAQVTQTAVAKTATASVVVIRVKSTQNINIRPNPGDNSQPTGNLRPNTEAVVDKISLDKAWVHLQAGGWISTQYIDTVQGSLANLIVSNQ